MEKYFCRECLAELQQGDCNYNYDTGKLDYVCPECGEEGVSPFGDYELHTFDDGRFALTLTDDDIDKCFHPGDCSDGCAEVIEKPYVQSQLQVIPKDVMVRFLDDYAIDYDKGDMDDIMTCFLWLVAGDLSEGIGVNEC